MGLSLIASSFSSASQLWKFGTQERTARGTPLTLVCSTLGNVAAVRFSSPRLQGATAGYQVTGGKTLVVLRARYWSSVAGLYFSIGYSDSDRGFSNAADGANPVGLDSDPADPIGQQVVLAANTNYDVDCYYEIPASKFCRLLIPITVAAHRAQLFCVEV